MSAGWKFPRSISQVKHLGAPCHAALYLVAINSPTSRAQASPGFQLLGQDLPRLRLILFLALRGLRQVLFGSSLAPA